ncbi:hypothetical protein LNO81_20285 [Klebsiella variicola subsp. variicola]|nr:hypothetical protein [Klebsiella variicola subsp. variicola]
MNKLKADPGGRGRRRCGRKQATIDDASARVQQAQAEYDRVTRDYQTLCQERPCRSILSRDRM